MMDGDLFGEPNSYFFEPGPVDNDPEATASELSIFTKEAVLDIRPDESSVQPMTPKRRRAFARIMRQVKEIEARGQMVVIPDDLGALPDEPNPEETSK